MPLKIVRNDITKMSVDAIVNAANSHLEMGGGVCGAIFSAAGAEALKQECHQLGTCKVGQAVITSGQSLTAKYIIHTVGPVWQGGSSGEAQQLHSCYSNSLKLALQHNCKSIAFPLISSGIYGYPKDQALQIAISAIGEFLINNDILVYLVVFDKKAYVLSEKLFTSIERFIDDNYVEEHLHYESHRILENNEIQDSQEVCNKERQPCRVESAVIRKKQRSLEDLIAQLEESFSQMLLRLIDEKGMTDVETYKRANIDRKLFSKIRSSKTYNPSKATAIAFAIALKLNLDETRDLMGKAGYTLSHSNKFDVIIEYFIQKGNYNVYEINQALFAFEQGLLGA